MHAKCLHVHMLPCKVNSYFVEGSETKEILYTVGRNPNWNPEIHCKSILKSRNPIWNPEIHSEIRKSTLKSGNLIQDSIKILRKYPYTLHWLHYTARTCTNCFQWRNRMAPRWMTFVPGRSSRAVADPSSKRQQLRSKYNMQRQREGLKCNMNI